MADPAVATEEVATEEKVVEAEATPVLKESLNTENAAAAQTADDEVKAEDAKAPLTPDDILDQKIVRQVEYYFGDANLPNDKFIKGECAKNEGWFPLTAILTFHRIQSLLSSVPKEKRIERIVSALRSSVLVDIDEKAENIRRNLEIPLPEGNSMERTVYVKGFNRNDTRLDDLLEFYSKYDGVDGVIMRWYKEKVILPPKKSEEGENGAPPLAEMANIGYSKKFKGSILLIFKSVEQSQLFLQEEKHSYAGVDMIRMPLKVYREKKKAEFDERQALKKNLAKSEAAPVVEEPLAEYAKGTLLKINEVPEGYSRETLKERFFSLAKQEEFPIAFVDFQRGDTNAVLRLEKAGAAEEAVKLIPDAKLPVGDDRFCQVELFTEEEEKAYHVKVRDNRLKLKRRGGGGGGRGFGGRGGGRGRHGARGHGGKRGRRY